jgi:hypothetical protein
MSRTVTMDWVAGASIGLLVGLLVGLSSSPVVATVVGALAALLGGVFGIAEKVGPNLNVGGARRLAAFALACIVGLVGGTLVRTHDLLAPSAAQLRKQAEEIGITDPKEQTSLMRFVRYGLLPPDTQAAGKDGAAAVQVVANRQGVLYELPADFCRRLDELVQNGSGTQDLLTHLRTGGKSAMQRADAIARLPAAEQLGALRAAPIYLCAP